MVESRQWTDFNESDPGITLLELSAFLTVGYFSMIGLGLLLRWLGLVKQVVNVEVDGKRWRQVEILEDAGRNARVFLVDPVGGSIQFGDGKHGRVPSGSVHVGTRYRYGAGAVGAVATLVVLCGGWFLSIWWRWRRRRRP